MDKVHVHNKKTITEKLQNTRRIPRCRFSVGTLNHICFDNQSSKFCCNDFQSRLDLIPLTRKTNTLVIKKNFRKNYKPVKKDRIFPKVTASSSSGPVSSGAKPLEGMKFVILKTTKSKGDVTAEIKNLGGEVVNKIEKSVIACISTKGTVINFTCMYVVCTGSIILFCQAASILYLSLQCHFGGFGDGILCFLWNWMYFKLI